MAAASWKFKLADPVLFLLMGMRALESLVIPDLVNNRVALDLNLTNFTHSAQSPCSGNTTAEHDKVQSIASRWLMVYWLASSLPGAITAVLLGGWSDRIGRKTPMLLGVAGYFVEAATATAVAAWQLPIPVLIAASAFEGVCGSYPTVLMAVYAYTSDISDSKSRTSRLLLLTILEYSGLAACQIGAGYLIKSHHGTMKTLAMVTSGHFLSIVYILFFLADSRHSPSSTASAAVSDMPTVPNDASSSINSDKVVAVAVDKQSYLYSLQKTFRLVLKPWPKRSQLLALLFSFELIVMNYLGIGDVYVLFLMHEPLCWASTMIGYFAASRYTALAISVGVCSPLILRFQPTDRHIVHASLFGIVFYFVFIAFADKTVTMFLSALFMLAAGACIPTMRSMMSKLVAPEDHGAVFATIASLETIITVLATVIYNNLYSYVIELDSFPHMTNNGSVCFLLAGVSNFIAFFAMFGVPAHSDRLDGYEPIGSA